jgi:glc operon protein GlcG
METPATRLTPSLTLAGARKAIAAAEAEAKRLDVDVSIAAVDAAGNLLAFIRHDDAMLVTIDAAVAKARTAAQTRISTRLLQELVDQKQPSLLAITQVTPAIGGIPISLNGCVVGAVAASGATLDHDEAVARAGANAVMDSTPSA